VLATPGLLLVTAAPAVATSAHVAAKTGKPGVLQSAWYWQTALQQANPPVDPNTVPATEPSGVPAGDLAVASTSNDGTSSKLTALAFDIGSLKPGTTIDEFTVTLTLDTSPTAASLNTAAAAPVACLPTRLWPTGDPGPIADAPAYSCDSKVAPKVDGNSYTFQIARLAQSWVDDQNLGVAFVNDPANTTAPFQLVFTGAKTVKATMRFTPPVTSGGSGGTGGGTTDGSAGGSGGTASGGSAPGAAGTDAPPPVPGSIPSAPPVTGDVAPPAAQPPQVAGDGQVPLVPIAKSAGAPSSPNNGFWIAGAALALLLVCAAVVLADSSVPVPTAAQTKLTRVLRDRERALETATSIPADHS
jgi:hypothetical protein